MTVGSHADQGGLIATRLGQVKSQAYLAYLARLPEIERRADEAERRRSESDQRARLDRVMGLIPPARRVAFRHNPYV